VREGFRRRRDREIIKTKTTTTIMTMSKTRTMVFVRDGRDAGWRTEHGNPASCFGFFVFARRRCLFSFFFRGCLTSIGGLSGIEAVLVVEDVSIPSDFFCLIFFYHSL